MKVPARAVIWLMPSAIPRWVAGKASVRIAVEFAMRKAAPTPWKSRITTSQTAAAVPCIQVTPRTSEKNV